MQNEKWKYSIFDEHRDSQDIGRHLSYGIELEEDKLRIPYISTCRNFVSHIVNLFNSHQVSPNHARDIIQNMLIDYFCESESV